MSKNNGTVLIKEIAAELNLSVGTVSLVLNGRGDKMRISKATQEKIKTLASQRGYHPNIYARRLRNAALEEHEHVLAVFWNYGYGDDIMGDFLKGLENAVEKKKNAVAFNIHMFENGHLCECEYLMTSTRYSAIIVCGMSKADSDFLNSKEFDLPVVNAFHNEANFHSIYVDSFSVGVFVANLFYEKGIRSAGYFGSLDGGTNSILRKKGFLMQAENLGIKVDESWIKEEQKRFVDSGIEAMQTLIDSNNIPKALFINVPEYAIGALIACRHNKFEAGKDIYILAAGTPRSFVNVKDKITAITVPVEAIAEETINILFTIFENNDKKIYSKILSAELIEGSTL